MNYKSFFSREPHLHLTDRPARSPDGTILFAAFVVMSLLVAPPLRAADAPAWMHALVNVLCPNTTRKRMPWCFIRRRFECSAKRQDQSHRSPRIQDPASRRAPFRKIPFLLRCRNANHEYSRWCIPAQGKDYEVKDKDTTERGYLDVEGGELYSDLHIKVMEIPASEPGNIIGYEIEHEDRPFIFRMNGYSRTGCRSARHVTHCSFPLAGVQRSFGCCCGCCCRTVVVAVPIVVVAVPVIVAVPVVVAVPVIVAVPVVLAAVILLPLVAVAGPLPVAVVPLPLIVAVAIALPLLPVVTAIVALPPWLAVATVVRGLPLAVATVVGALPLLAVVAGRCCSATIAGRCRGHCCRCCPATAARCGRCCPAGDCRHCRSATASCCRAADTGRYRLAGHSRCRGHCCRGWACPAGTIADCRSRNCRPRPGARPPRRCRRRRLLPGEARASSSDAATCPSSAILFLSRPAARVVIPYLGQAGPG